MGNRTPNYGIDSANEAERAIWARVLAGSAAVLAGIALTFLYDDKPESDSTIPSVPSSVDISIEP